MGLDDAFDVFEEDSDVSKNDPKQIREPIPMEEWVDSEYHIGSAASSLYSFWKPKLIKFVEEDYDEGIFTGGKRAGKTWVSMLLLVRKIYELSCYEYPQRLYDLDDNTTISVAYFSVNEHVARDTGWDDLKGLIAGTPYFEEDYVRNKNLESQLEWRREDGYNEVIATYGSNENTVRGSALIAHVLDEAGFFKRGGGRAGGDVQQVRDINNDAIERRKLQYSSDGQDPGFAITISSATDASSYVEERRQKAGEDGLYVRAVNYKVFPDDYSDDKLTVFVGSDKHEPQLIDDSQRLKKIIEDIDGYQPGGNTVDEVYEDCPPDLQTLFERPPVNFRERFESDIISSIRGICGRPIGGSGSFFSNQEVFNQCVAENLKYPFTREDFIISTEAVEPVDHFFNPGVLCEKEGDYWEPKRHPSKKRYVYIDLSSQHDYTGISMCHIAGVVREQETGITRPQIEYDFMVRISPPQPPARLDHSKIVNFIFLLKNRYNFPIKRVGLDQYQSEAKIQNFNKNLLTGEEEDADTISVDKDDSKWLDFLSLMYNRSVKFHASEAFETELFDLEHDRSKRKVDHPQGGYNDLSCSVVGASSMALENDDEEQEPIDPDDYEVQSNRIQTQEDLQKSWRTETEDGEEINPFQSEEGAKGESDVNDIFDAIN